MPGKLDKRLWKNTMRKRLTPEEKKQYVIKQTLTSREIERLENNSTSRPVSQSELDALLTASRSQKPA